MKLFKTVLITSLVAFIIPTLLHADPRNCGQRAAIVDRLQDRFGETRKSVGLGANNAMVEVFASDTTGSWTITVTTPGGPTCLVASGQAFETIAAKLPDPSEEDA
ncbi:hypothetical protein [Nereida sp. MMG025]|uniref:hypothetical protein n=1 Tax=Nereida sp. MMG025 TaxID=2909981 RepID=UPI001F490CAA|nr:hypothetical protein [Nereida sp. MMG025]MCF6445497.1 hypothetical protein [Nereida sp. MMG025]